MGSALSVKNYESPADRRLAGGFLADTNYCIVPEGYDTLLLNSTRTESRMAWNDTTCKEYDCKINRYPSDTSDGQWANIEPLVLYRPSKLQCCGKIYRSLDETT